MTSQLNGLLGPRVRDFARRILGRSAPWGLSDQTRKHLTMLPRYQRQEIEFFGRPLKICDSASFLSAWKEIFQGQIYRFKTSNPAPLIIDAGANLGLASIYLSKMFPNARLIAIESDPDICELLRANLAAQGVKRAEVLQRAVWDSEELLRFAQDHADAGRVNGAGTVEVQGLRLRDMLKQAETVDFLKLDIEGAEVRVLSDCQDSLECVQRLFVEFHSLVGQPQQLSELLSVLQYSGFRYYIERVGICSGHPFAGLQEEQGFDLQLNIWGVRRKT